MEKLEAKTNAWLREHLIPRLAGVFREKCKPGRDELECKLTRPRGSFYLSDLFFATIRFPGSAEAKSLVIKLPAQDPNVSKRQNYDFLFANEMLFYDGLAAGNSDYPRCYLCGDDPVFRQVIVLENVCPRGYVVCPEKTNLHLDHLIAGLQSIGRLHGNTYALKELEPKKFQQLVADIIKVRYHPDQERTAGYAREVNKRITRVTRALRARSFSDPIFSDRMARLFEDCYVSVLMRSVEPREPLATIVHGDCTVNNILYRSCSPTDDEDGRGASSYEAMLVDFALIMYSSPATDVSTFLYMSASRLDVKEHFQQLFQAYHDALRNYLKEHKAWDPQKYSYEAFLEDYRRTAIFGYVMSTFFLPMMTEYEKNNDMLEDADAAIERFNMTGGGEALSNQLVDTLLDMRDAGLLDCYVNNRSDC